MPVNKDMVEQGMQLILEGIGEDPLREGLIDTPARIARMYEEILSGMAKDPSELFSTSFGESHHEMVLVRDIPFYSLCEHHMVPFFGHAHVGYIPGHEGRICGISKLARLVDIFANRLQVQERLTTQIADTLVEQLEPDGVIVAVGAEHLCMAMRGIKKPGTTTVTSAVRGVFESSARTRAEALSLILNAGAITS